MNKLYTVMVILLLAFAAGCKTEAQIQQATPPVVNSVGAIITETAGPQITLKAYMPEFSVILDTSKNTLPVTITLIVDNVAANALTLSGISPTTMSYRTKTKVAYEFSLPPEKIHTLHFTTPTKPIFSFVVIGDNRDGRTTYLKLLDKINAARPAFVINGGDLVPSGELEQYKQFITDTQICTVPYYTVLGNHDIYGEGRSFYNKLLAPDFYAFTWGNVKCIILDNANGTISDKQFKWLETELNNRTTEHVFLFMHKPPFDPRLGQNHTMNSKAEAEKLMQLAANYHVSAVFASHIHLFTEAKRYDIPYYFTGGTETPLSSDHSNVGVYQYILVAIDKEKVVITPVMIP